MRLSVFTTMSNPTFRRDPWISALDCYADLADEIVIVNGDPEHTPIFNTLIGARADVKVVESRWPHEFKWSFIGKQFQKGYEACSGDFVIHADLDYIFHENDIPKIRRLLEKNLHASAYTFYKYQFLKWDRYQIKARCPILVNKREFGSRLKWQYGGDLCQPGIDGKAFRTDQLMEAQIPFYNYDFTMKTEEVVKTDFGRFARAWYREFKEYKLGGPSDESALEYFKHMMKGRWNNRDFKQIKLEDHPKYIQRYLTNLTKKEFGHSGWGMF